VFVTVTVVVTGMKSIMLQIVIVSLHNNNKEAKEKFDVISFYFLLFSTLILRVCSPTSCRTRRTHH